LYVRHLSVTDFRSWPAAEVAFEPGPSVLVGPNGQGKTNLVEALGYVATLGSHRVATDAPLVREGAARAVVRTAIVSAGRELLVELEINPGRANRARLNRGPVPRPREVLGALRSVLFAPEDLALVRGDPGERRRFLDELLTQRTPRYAGVRADYDRVLKQRGALLKTARAHRGSGAGADLRTLDVWDGHPARYGFGAKAMSIRRSRTGRLGTSAGRPVTRRSAAPRPPPAGPGRCGSRPSGRGPSSTGRSSAQRNARGFGPAPAPGGRLPEDPPHRGHHLALHRLGGPHGNSARRQRRAAGSPESAAPRPSPARPSRCGAAADVGAASSSTGRPPARRTARKFGPEPAPGGRQPGDPPHRGHDPLVLVRCGAAADRRGEAPSLTGVWRLGGARGNSV
jgi:hypothetical protein